VEVREQGVDPAELEARGDEEVGAAGERLAPGEGLEHAHRRRADRDARRSAAWIRSQDAGATSIALAVERMILEPAPP